MKKLDGWMRLGDCRLDLESLGRSSFSFCSLRNDENDNVIVLELDWYSQ